MPCTNWPCRITATCAGPASNQDVVEVLVVRDAALSAGFVGQVYPPLPKVRPELPPPRRPPRRTVPGGRQVVNFRLGDREEAALESRREQLQVESMSEFVTTIIELDLGADDGV
jgi:hypothetical protein